MEPMTLGSPTTQHSPANQSGNLPGFLLGEPSHQRTNTFSPTKKTLSFVTSPHHQSIHNIYSSPTQETMNPRSSFNQSFGMGMQQQQQQQQQAKLFKYHPTSHDNSISAPPTLDLFDSLREERPTPVKNVHQGITSPFQQQQQQFESFAQMDNSGFNVSRVMSPIHNISMNETQSRNKAPFSSFWVTVFGFPPSSVATILSHFAQCGTIVDKMFSPQNGNWIHLRFSSRIECDKALNFNGKVIANSLMIGVVQCTEQSIIHEDILKEDRENITKMRPLSRVTYETTQSPTKVEPHVFAPKMNNGIVSKALDMFFGW